MINKEKFFFAVEKCMRGEKRNLFVQGLLYFLSLFWRLGAHLKNYAYEKGLLQIKKASGVVVSVGNIVAGGSGKTPFILFLADKFEQKSKIAILSRGYRSKIEKTGRNLLFSHKDMHSFEEVGDEPLILAKKLLKSLVVVGKNRIKSSEIAKKQGAKIILLDDGLQYRKLKKDCEIVVLNGKNLFGGGYFLPRGFLRDSPKRLSCADLIVINNLENIENYRQVKALLAQYTKAPVVAGFQKVIGIKDLVGQKVTTNLGDKVAALCAIGHPKNFLDTVNNMGLEIVLQKTLADHSFLTRQELIDFALQAKGHGASYIVCTEKDSVKIPKSVPFALPIYFVETVFEIMFGKEHVNNLIAKIEKMAENI